MTTSKILVFILGCCLQTAPLFPTSHVQESRKLTIRRLEKSNVPPLGRVILTITLGTQRFANSVPFNNCNQQLQKIESDFIQSLGIRKSARLQQQPLPTATAAAHILVGLRGACSATK